MIETLGELLTVPVSSSALPPGKWPKSGSWSVEDWERLPDEGRRYEIIGGVLYMTTAPSAAHQWSSMALSRLLGNHLAEQTPPVGILFTAPFGVTLPTGAVIPDLVYLHIRNVDILRAKRIIGVPDLVVEIASPGTASYDRREKQDAYARSGVPEYWWIDPAHRTVEVLVLQSTGVYRPLALVSGRQTIPSVQVPGLSFMTEEIFMPRDLEYSLASE
jgi:Uma2 family endonuclease